MRVKFEKGRSGQEETNEQFCCWQRKGLGRGEEDAHAREKAYNTTPFVQCISNRLHLEGGVSAASEQATKHKGNKRLEVKRPRK